MLMSVKGGTNLWWTGSPVHWRSESWTQRQEGWRRTSWRRTPWWRKASVVPVSKPVLRGRFAETNSRFADWSTCGVIQGGGLRSSL